MHGRTRENIPISLSCRSELSRFDSIRHLATFARPTNLWPSQSRLEGETREREGDGERWRQGERDTKRERVLRGETIAFPLAGFLSSYRNSIDTPRDKFHFAPATSFRRIRGIELAVNIRSLHTWNFYATSAIMQDTRMRRIFRFNDWPIENDDDLMFTCQSFGSAACISARKRTEKRNERRRVCLDTD